MNSITNSLTDSDNDRQKELLIYFQNLEQQVYGWQVAIDQLTNNRFNLNDSAIFFYLKIIECYVKNRFETDNEANKLIVKQYVYKYFTSKKYDFQIFILNKFAGIVSSLFVIEYPLGRWTLFFEDFLTHCNNKESSYLFLRILVQINIEIGEREHIPKIENIDKATVIKDLMRENAVSSIIQFWFNVMSTYHNSDPAIVNYCLLTMSKYADWIDVKMISDDPRMTDLLNLLHNNQIKISVLDFLYGFLHKGMDPISKAILIEQFCQQQCLNELFLKDYNKNENEFVIKLAKFFNKIGIELIESFKKFKNSKSVDQNYFYKLDFLFIAIEKKFSILCKFLTNDDFKISIQVHPFVREFVQLIKNLNKEHNQFSISNNKISQIIMVAEILIKQYKYPDDFQFSMDILDDKNEFQMYRKSCNVLLNNINLLDKDLFGQFVFETFIETTLDSNNLMNFKFNQLEITLYFFKYIGDWLKNKNNQKFNKLMKNLVTSSIIDYPHILIKFMYFELICKYEKQFCSLPLNELLPQVLTSFLDKNGIKSSSILLRCKVSSIFNRFIKSIIKNKENNKKFLIFSQEIIRSIEPILKFDYYLSYKGKAFIEFNINDQQIQENRNNHLFLIEAISHLIVQNDLIESREKLHLLKKVFLDLILENISESSNFLQTILLNNTKIMISESKVDKQIKMICEDIAHLINLVVHSMKAITNLDMKVIGGQPIFLDIFNNFVKFLSLNLSDECLNILQKSICHFLHQLIFCLDDDQILPLLPILIQKVLLARSYFTVFTIHTIVPLINRVVTEFNQSCVFDQHFLPFLKALFLPFLSNIFNLIDSENLEDDEKINLQKIYFSFIFTIINFVPKVVKNSNTQIFEKILWTLNQGLQMNDLIIQKNCVNIFKRLVENHGCIFENENLTNEICLISASESNNLLFKCIYTSAIPITIDLLLRIPDQNQIINEVLNFLITVYQLRGKVEFTQFFKIDQFSNYGVNANQLCEAFDTKDLKTLKILFREIKQVHETLI